MMLIPFDSLLCLDLELLAVPPFIWADSFMDCSWWFKLKIMKLDTFGSDWWAWWLLSWYLSQPTVFRLYIQFLFTHFSQKVARVLVFNCTLVMELLQWFSTGRSAIFVFTFDLQIMLYFVGYIVLTTKCWSYCFPHFLLGFGWYYLWT